uniref:NADH-ubiquinone oxidoreductase chain 4L n=1 Tax=Acanthochitona avicula TaxID=1503212 RepID=A0A6H1PGE0_9MOLL|nr:NADH dehydrogenase subunit 4L [Acanthochitona avicula]QIZ12684.1 NADH dehydrogenase subunit 4L [Acanthochitona avicula]
MMNFFNPLLTLGLLSSVSALITICLQRKHILNALIILEILMVSIFLILISLAAALHNEGLMIFIILTLAACEASMGLAMLVILIRTHGNDYMTSISSNKW